MLLNTPNPFCKWHINQRYNHRNHFQQTVVEHHRQGAQMAIKVLQAADLDGVFNEQAKTSFI